MNKKLLITGGGGFLGSYIVRECLRQHCEVTLLRYTSNTLWRLEGLKNQLNINYEIDTNLDNLFRSQEFDGVIHTATAYDRNEKDLSVIAQTNILHPLKLLELCQKYQSKTFINTDTFLRTNYPDQPGYSLSKSQFSQWMKLYPKVRCLNLELQHPYGPRDHLHKFIPFLISVFRQNKATLPLTTGEQLRDFIFVEDTAEAIVKAAIHSEKLASGFHHFEIGTGCSHSIRQLVTILKKTCGNTQTQLMFGKLPYRENEIMNSKADISSFTKVFSWQPQTSLEKGLQKTVNEQVCYKI